MFLFLVLVSIDAILLPVVNARQRFNGVIRRRAENDLASSFLSGPTTLHYIKPQNIADSDLSTYNIATIRDEVFLARDEYIDVYNAKTFAFTRRITFPEKEMIDMTACEESNTLYMLSDQQVYKLDLSTNQTSHVRPRVHSWIGLGSSLSMSKQCHLIVTDCLYSTKLSTRLQEYSPDGSLIRESIIERNYSFGMDGFQLSNGQFVISFLEIIDKPSVVCLVNDSGIIKCQDEGDTEHKLILLAVDSFDHVYALDGRNKIQVFTPDLTFFWDSSKHHSWMGGRVWWSISIWMNATDVFTWDCGKTPLSQ